MTDEERFPKIITKAWDELAALKGCRADEITIEYVNGRPTWIIRRRGEGRKVNRSEK